MPKIFFSEMHICTNKYAQFDKLRFFKLLLLHIRPSLY